MKIHVCETTSYHVLDEDGDFICEVNSHCLAADICDRAHRLEGLRWDIEEHCNCDE